MRNKKGNSFGVSKKYIFFDFLAKQDRLIRWWLNIELWIMVTICLLSLVCMIEGYAVIAWIAAYFLITIIMAIVNPFKTVIFYKLLKKAEIVISKHKDPKLREIFQKGPKYLKWAIILDIFYPVTWIFGFLFKLAFFKNANNMKALLTSQKTI